MLLYYFLFLFLLFRNYDYFSENMEAKEGNMEGKEKVSGIWVVLLSFFLIKINFLKN